MFKFCHLTSRRAQRTPDFLVHSSCRETRDVSPFVPRRILQLGGETIFYTIGPLPLVVSFLVRVGSEARACVRSVRLGRRRRAWRSDLLGCAFIVRGSASRRGSCPSQCAPASRFELALPSPEGRSQSSSSAGGLVEPACPASALRASTLSVPRAVAADPSTSAALASK